MLIVRERHTGQNMKRSMYSRHREKASSDWGGKNNGEMEKTECLDAKN